MRVGRTVLENLGRAPTSEIDLAQPARGVTPSALKANACSETRRRSSGFGHEPPLIDSW